MRFVSTNYRLWCSLFSVLLSVVGPGFELRALGLLVVVNFLNCNWTCSLCSLLLKSQRLEIFWDISWKNQRFLIMNISPLLKLFHYQAHSGLQHHSPGECRMLFTALVAFVPLSPLQSMVAAKVFTIHPLLATPGLGLIFFLQHHVAT
jgi:hypothetical protein